MSVPHFVEIKIGFQDISEFSEAPVLAQGQQTGNQWLQFNCNQFNLDGLPVVALNNSGAAINHGKYAGTSTLNTAH